MSGEVTQADRNFAADYLRDVGKLNDRDHENICQGLWDRTPHVKDIAEFRLATRQQPEAGREGEVADMREAAAKVADALAEHTQSLAGHAHPLPMDTNEGWRRVRDGALDIAETIRALPLLAATRLAVPTGVGREEVARVVLLARQYANVSEDEVGGLPVAHLAGVLRDLSTAVIGKA